MPAGGGEPSCGVPLQKAVQRRDRPPECGEPALVPEALHERGVTTHRSSLTGRREEHLMRQDAEGSDEWDDIEDDGVLDASDTLDGDRVSDPLDVGIAAADRWHGANR